MSAVPIQENLQFMNNRLADILTMSDDLGAAIDSMNRLRGLVLQLGDTTGRMHADMADVTSTVDEIRDHIADFDDVARPVRNYFYWEQHCADIPVCHAVRSVFDAYDGMDRFSQKMRPLLDDINDIDAVMPQIVEQFTP